MKKTQVLKSKNFYLATRYAITINLNDKWQFFGSCGRLDRAKAFLSEQLIHLTNNDTHYELYCELSEPRDNTISKNGPRVHFHGVIYFENVRAVRHFLLYEWYSLSRYSKFKIDSIDNIEIWESYCQKQQNIIHTHEIHSGLDLFGERCPIHEEEAVRLELFGQNDPIEAKEPEGID